jgi:hypothetical protein
MMQVLCHWNPVAEFGIEAKAFVMPASTDLYFPPADSVNE